MSKTQLQTNNAKLEALITELQGKAAGGGSGGSVETCTVTLMDAPDFPAAPIDDQNVFYIDANGIPAFTTMNIGSTITVMKDSLFVISPSWSSMSYADNALKLNAYQGTAGYKITGNAIIYKAD